MERTQAIMFELLRCALCGTKLSDQTKELLTSERLRQIFNLTKMHDIAHLLTDVLWENGLLIKGTDVEKSFHRSQQMAVYRYEQMRYETEHIYQVLEEAGIQYMPLKGALLRDYYPEPWMRTSCDIDVLVKEENLSEAAQALDYELHYANKGGFSHDVSLYADNGVHLELHYKLIEEEVFSIAALQNVWDDAICVDGCKYALGAEVFYLYHITHMAKHLIGGGCGIRPFLDLWLLEQKMPYDKQKVDQLLKDAGLFVFAEAARKLARVWLSGEDCDELTATLQEYILKGGVYGISTNKITVQVAKKGKLKYLFSRIFMPYSELKCKYPSLKKVPILYPFYLLRRWFNLLFVKGKAKESWNEFGNILSKEKDEEIVALLKRLEL